MILMGSCFGPVLAVLALNVFCAVRPRSRQRFFSLPRPGSGGQRLFGAHHQVGLRFFPLDNLYEHQADPADCGVRCAGGHEQAVPSSLPGAIDCGQWLAGGVGEQCIPQSVSSRKGHARLPSSHLPSSCDARVGFQGKKKSMLDQLSSLSEQTDASRQRVSELLPTFDKNFLSRKELQLFAPLPATHVEPLRLAMLDQIGGSTEEADADTQGMRDLIGSSNLDAAKALRELHLVGYKAGYVQETQLN